KSYFYSSRRRHTRFSRDWSSDVCSSDLVTKYIGGHSDVVMGALIVNDEELYKRLFFLYNACGGTPGPQDAFLVLRGIKTLHVRRSEERRVGKERTLLRSKEDEKT